LNWAGASLDTGQGFKVRSGCHYANATWGCGGMSDTFLFRASLIWLAIVVAVCGYVLFAP
jgi:hypothetical protein